MWAINRLQRALKASVKEIGLPSRLVVSKVWCAQRWKRNFNTLLKCLYLCVHFIKDTIICIHIWPTNWNQDHERTGGVEKMESSFRLTKYLKTSRKSCPADSCIKTEDLGHPLNTWEKRAVDQWWYSGKH